MKTTILLVFLFFCVTTIHAETFDWAQIGNAGNAGDVQSQGTFGAVAYNYAISKTEVTNTQYTKFLNAVAASDPFGLYNPFMGSATQSNIIRNGTTGNYSYIVRPDGTGTAPQGTRYTYADKPVIYVSWYDSLRYINWLHNGEGNGDTETGAYTLLGSTPIPSNALSIIRNSGAKYWLPSEDEWYKSAYHDASAGTAGTYFNYATGSNTAPDNRRPSSDTGNSANHRDRGFTLGRNYSLTDVGAYGLSESPYGTYDQNGNVWEWNEALINSSWRGMRGGAWGNEATILAASFRNSADPANEFFAVGFRVATVSVPEPTSLLLLVCLAGGMMVRSRR